MVDEAELTNAYGEQPYRTVGLLIWENVFHDTVTAVSPAYATRTWELIVLFMAALA